MTVLRMVTWWYSRGLMEVLKRWGQKMRNMANFFSIKSLIRTLFAPFRQISVGEAGPSLGDKLRGFLDKTVSRAVGAVVRIFLMVVGLIAMVAELVIAGAAVLLWLVTPVAPVLCVVLAVMGVTI